MCPACLAAAAMVAAKVASAGGLAAYGVKKLIATGQPKPTDRTLEPLGDSNATAEDRVR